METARVETETEDSRNDGCRAESTCYPLRRKSRRSNYFSRMVRSLKDRGGVGTRDLAFYEGSKGSNKRKEKKLPRFEQGIRVRV